MDVSPTSPAKALAASLTDPETRGEWVSEFQTHPYSVGTRYTNAARDICVGRYSSIGLMSVSGVRLTTPFTLTKAEEKIVCDALDAFDRRRREEHEREVLARLLAPAAGIEARSDGTVKQGPARRAKARSRKGAAQ